MSHHILHMLVISRFDHSDTGMRKVPAVIARPSTVIQCSCAVMNVFASPGGK